MLAHLSTIIAFLITGQSQMQLFSDGLFILCAHYRVYN